jgi:cbb3-type cytochrome oxidase maturation protein
MSIILVLIPVSILFAVAFLAAFIWAVRSGQYEDTCTPAMRVLAEEAANKPVKAIDQQRRGADSQVPVPPAQSIDVQTMARSEQQNLGGASSISAL